MRNRTKAEGDSAEWEVIAAQDFEDIFAVNIALSNSLLQHCIVEGDMQADMHV